MSNGRRMSGRDESVTLARRCRGFVAYQSLGILDTPSHASDTASGLHCLQPLPLIGAQPASSGLDLDAGKDGHLLAHHVRCDRARRPADQIRAALGEAKLHRPAVGIAQGAGVVAMQAHRASAAL